MTEPRPTIGIITALPLEQAAMVALLDNVASSSIEAAGTRWPVTFGTLLAVDGVHQVVVAQCGMGNNNSATCATFLLSHFGQIGALLMVGIAGGAPCPIPEKIDRHVRLGDIVVSDGYGVVQYDYGKQEMLPGQPAPHIEYRNLPRPPGAELLRYARQLQVGELQGRHPWLAQIERAIAALGNDWRRPQAKADILHSLADGTPIPHPKDRYRRAGEPKVLLGAIASGDMLQKDPRKRDELRDRFNVRAIEMEGGGIADATYTMGRDYLIVRGVCDYCDPWKSNDWQRYAAVVAAAYARALLETLPAARAGDDQPANPSTDVRGLPNPYRGLRAFTYDDSASYGGRQSDIEIALKGLTAPGAQQTLLFVTGASGSGKSSFVQAGLLPALEQHYQQRDMRFKQAVMRPAAAPLAALAAALAALDRSVADVSASYAEVPEPSPPALRQPAVGVLVIDQFEELFTQSAPDQRDALLGMLGHMPPFVELHLHVIATLRSDYLPDLFASSALYQVAKHGVELQAMGEAELKIAIRQPLQHAGQADQRLREKQFDPALLGKLARDSAGDAAYLPLLQVTLEDLWTRGSLALGAYGNLTDAIRDQAERVYAFVDYDGARIDKRRSEDRAALLAILLDMVEVSLDEDARRDVRRQLPAAELENGDPRRARLIDDLVRARLLSKGVGRDDAELVDIIHESLIANWQRLRDAIAERRADLQQSARFRMALRDYGRDGRLLEGVALAEAEALALRGDVALRGVDAHGLLARSREQRDLIHQRELEQARTLAEEQERRAEAERGRADYQSRSRRRFTWLSAGLALVVLFASAAGLFANNQRIMAQTAQAIAQQRARETDSQRLAANAQSFHDQSADLALRLAYAGAQLDDNPVTYIQLQREIDRSALLVVPHGNTVYNAMFSPDGALIATASADKTVRLWDARNGTELKRFSHDDYVYKVIFSSDGAHILTVSADKTARLWDARSGAELKRFTHEDAVVSAVFSSDGNRILTASYDHTARLWDANSGAELKRFTHDDRVNSAVFSPDGSRILTASSDWTARLWDASSGTELKRFTHDDDVYSAVFSLDGTRILTASVDKTARLWDASRGTELKRLAQDTEVNSAVFSPDGNRILTTSPDNTARLWDASSGAELTRFAYDAEIYSAVFSPDGSRILTASRDRTARLWDASSGVELKRFIHDAEVFSAVFSPDGSRILTASRDRTARLWDASSNTELRRFAHDAEVFSVAFSPDGNRILTTSRDRTARLWDATSGAELKRFSQDVYVYSAVFSPDGNRILTASAFNNVRLWDARNGAELKHFTHDAEVNRAVFSPDGNRILTTSRDNTARLWDATSGAELKRFTHDDYVNSAVFSPDGNRTLTTSRDNTARLWDATSGAELNRFTHDDDVYSAVFSPDGNRILTASADKTARLWDASSGAELKRFTHDAEVNSAVFSPDGSRVLTASRDRTARMWDASSGTELKRFTHDDDVYSATFSPDGSRILTASADKTARLWDASGGVELNRFTHDDDVYSAVFSPDGSRILTASADKTARLYTIATRDLLTLATCSLTRSFSPDEKRQYVVPNDLQLDLEQRRCPASFIQSYWPARLVDQGLIYVRAGYVDTALAVLHSAHTLSVTLDLDPSTPEREQNPQLVIDHIKGLMHALSLIDAIPRIIESGDINETFRVLDHARQLAPNVAIDTKIWNEICWWGSLYRYDEGTDPWRYKERVLAACQQAVASNPNNGEVRDSRGVAEALAERDKGTAADYSAAIADFEAFVRWSAETGRDTSDASLRRDWIDALTRKENPFDEALMVKLWAASP